MGDRIVDWCYENMCLCICSRPSFLLTSPASYFSSPSLCNNNFDDDDDACDDSPAVVWLFRLLILQRSSWNKW